jgi:hypothetical protein
MAPTCATGEMSLAVLSTYFHLPEKQVAQQLGICLTSLKKIARSLGVTRWPFRKLRSLERSIKKLGDDTTSLSAMAKTAIANPAAAQGLAIAAAVRPVAAIPVTMATPAIPILHSEVKVDSAPANRRPAAEEEVSASTSSSSDEPTCRLANETSLIIENWSALWTQFSLRKYLLTPLGGNAMTFSDDGCHVTLRFGSSAVALQAKNICEQACSLVAKHTVPTPESPESEASESEVECSSAVSSPQEAATSEDDMEHQPLEQLPEDIFVTTQQPYSVSNAFAPSSFSSLSAAVAPGSFLAPCSQAHHLLSQPGSRFLMDATRSSWDMGMSSDLWSSSSLLSF